MSEKTERLKGFLWTVLIVILVVALNVAIDLMNGGYTVERFTKLLSQRYSW
jgi:hypothetical protein